MYSTVGEKVLVVLPASAVFWARLFVGTVVEVSRPFVTVRYSGPDQPRQGQFDAVSGRSLVDHEEATMFIIPLATVARLIEEKKP